MEHPVLVLSSMLFRLYKIFRWTRSYVHLPVVAAQVSRHIARLTVTAFDWDANPETKVRCRKVLRMVVLHFFVIIE